MNKSIIFIVCILLLSIFSPLVYGQKIPCYTQSQQNCLFTNLIPFILLYLVIVFLLYIKFRKKISKLSLKNKASIVTLAILLLYIIAVFSVKLIFRNQCL